jgi:hypothetical protein
MQWCGREIYRTTNTSLTDAVIKQSLLKNRPQQTGTNSTFNCRDYSKSILKKIHNYHDFKLTDIEQVHVHRIQIIILVTSFQMNRNPNLLWTKQNKHGTYLLLQDTMGFKQYWNRLLSGKPGTSVGTANKPTSDNLFVMFHTYALFGGDLENDFLQ